LFAWADEEARIIVTRDRKLLLRREASAAFFVGHNDTRRQFETLATHFGLVVSPEDLMSRCARCNHFGYVELTSAQARERQGEVPERVLAAIDSFWLCPRCFRIYWQGTSYAGTAQRFHSLFDFPPGEGPERP
jgi:uncharacterized protein with PIN domain